MGDPGVDDTEEGAAEEVDDDLVTAADVETLNRAVVSRAAIFARFGGVCLIVAGAVGAVLWAWVTYRQQVVGYEAIYGFDPPEAPPLTVAQRADLFAEKLPMLLFASLTLGMGLLLRLIAEYTRVQVGISLTGYEEGDRFPPEPDEERDAAEDRT